MKNINYITKLIKYLIKNKHSNNNQIGGNLSIINKIVRTKMSNDVSTYIDNLIYELFSGIMKPVITFDNIKHRLPYEYIKKHNENISQHIGQRKLFVSELQFLTQALNNIDEEGYVIYAGAAPGHHTGYLASFFPNLKWILVDPRSVDLYEASVDDISKMEDNKIVDYVSSCKNKIYALKRYFNNKLANILKSLDNIYFISDIRTVHDESEVTDAIIIWNNAQQYNWLHILEPTASLLKFRCPYFEDGSVDKIEEDKIKMFDLEYAKKYDVDFLGDYRNRKIRYFDAPIYLQAYAPIRSTETRLYVKDIDKLKEYDQKEYEEKMQYYNFILRNYGTFENDNIMKEIGFDMCNDCSIENQVWKEYNKKIKKIDIKKCIEKLTTLLKRPLKTGKHGELFDLMTREKILELFELFE